MTTLLNRRQFAQTATTTGILGLSQSLFPSWMPRFALRSPNSSRPTGDVMIAIFQRGGMDGLNTVVPYGDGAGYYDKRPTIAIAAPGKGSKTAIDLDGHFGLHPALAPLKAVFDAKHLAVIHAAGSPDPSRSHFDAMEYMERGTPGDKLTGGGWINRHLQAAAWQNDSPFRAVGMGSMMPTSLSGAVPALALQSIADFHLRGHDDQLAALQQTLTGLYSLQTLDQSLNRQASEVFSTMALLSKISAVHYAPANGATYPDTDYGRGLQQLAQLIKADVGLEVGCVDIGGWDMHEAEADQLSAILTEFGQGLAAFHADLGDLINQVTVVTMSEFGRRVEENYSKGTDHGHGNAMFVMGGGVNGGMHVDWPGLAADKLDDGDLAITTDFRDVLSEIIIARLLNPALDKIFPSYTPKMRGIVQKRMPSP